MSSSPVQPDSDSAGAATETRWRLIGDLLVFSLKAAIEAIRDVLLIPIAVTAGLLGLLLSRDDPDAFFNEVVRGGQRFDRWLNLFGRDEAVAESDLAGSGSAPPVAGPAGLDALVAKVEQTLVEQHQRGGVTAQAKGAIDRALDSVQRTVGRSRRSRDDES